MKNEIYILCNSPQCLNEISSGNYLNLHNKNIFTCNLAYSYFRTSARHLNIFTDAPAINDFLNHSNWYHVYSTNPYNNVEFIINKWESPGVINFNNWEINLYSKDLKQSFICIPASSAIAALFYLHKYENFDTIHLIGYTLNEWEGLENNSKLFNKIKAFKDLLTNYEVINPRPYVYEYKIK